ncbi:MAG: glutathione S-transferase family protein [Lautropia sp.]
MLRVLGRSNSINVRKVLWLCAELDLPIAHAETGRDPAELRGPEFLRLNPNGKVPVIVDDSLVLWESNTIIRYLAGRAGRDDLLPAAPLPRARVEQWMDWAATDLNSAWRYAFMALVRRDPGYGDAAEVALARRPPFRRHCGNGVP